MIDKTDIQQIAFNLGADLCGFASVDRFGQAPTGFHPRDIYPETETVCVIAKCFPKGPFYAQNIIPYSAANTYARALLVGALNTLKVAFVGIILTIFLGTLLGIARLSSNWLVSRTAAAYIEVMQDIPVLLQLFFWYAIFYESLPSPREALNPISGLFLCNRGVIFSIPESHSAHQFMLIALGLAIVLAFFIIFHNLLIITFRQLFFIVNVICIFFISIKPRLDPPRDKARARCAKSRNHESR